MVKIKILKKWENLQGNPTFKNVYRTLLINNYKERFAESKKNQITNHISLRFFERIHNDSTASERGIYRLIVNKGKDAEQIYYGQFHVILKKEYGKWKIFMDYDSNPNNSIGESNYLKASSLDNYDIFINGN